MTEDIVYVVYFDGEMYKGHSYKNRKCTYTKVGGARQIITEDAKHFADMMCEENDIEYYDLNKEQTKEWLNKAKQRFEIKEFVERG